MLADKLGKSDTGTGDSPCTLQVPPTSRQILMRKLIVVGLSSVHGAMDLDRYQAEASECHRDPRQDEKIPTASSIVRCHVLGRCAVVP